MKNEITDESVSVSSVCLSAVDAPDKNEESYPYSIEVNRYQFAPGWPDCYEWKLFGIYVGLVPTVLSGPSD